MEKSQLNESRIDLSREIPLDSPLVLYIEPSSYCNLKCKFCPQYLDPKKILKKNLTLAFFQKAIDNLCDFKSPLKLLRICGTGDPLMNKNISEMILYATKANNKNKIFEKIELITNGILLNEKNMPVLGNNLSRLIVSIEGLSDQEYYDWTDTKTNFAELVKKLKYFKSIKSSTCQIHIKIHSGVIKTLDRANEFKALFESIGDSIEIQALVDMWPETDSSYVPIKNLHRYKKDINETKICAQIFKTMQVNSDGTVIPCSIDWQAVNKIGNLSDSCLIEIWNSNEMRNFRLDHLKNKLNKTCAACNFNEYSDIDSIGGDLNAIIERL